MARGVLGAGRVEDLSNAEIERLEARLFCLGGPPSTMCSALQMAAARILDDDAPQAEKAAHAPAKRAAASR